MKLTEERIQKLDSLGLEDKYLPWDERFNQLAEFHAQHGHCKVPMEQKSLNKWVAKQRYLRRGDKLTEERIQKLDSLGFGWADARSTRLIKQDPNFDSIRDQEDRLPYTSWCGDSCSMLESKFANSSAGESMAAPFHMATPLPVTNANNQQDPPLTSIVFKNAEGDECE